jgi:glycosyltransferase involved in cell wall biosynthesis
MVQNIMNISFIVPVYNEESTIVTCIEAILAQLCYGDEIIVVDNGSTDKTLAYLSLMKDVNVISNPGVTIAAVRNSGAEIATNEVLAFVDADCVLSPHWRDAVVDTLEDKRVGATGSKVDIPTDAVWIERAWYSQRSSGCSQASYINSGNLVVRKNVFDEVGGFWESLTTGEDSELGWRINRAGYVVFSNPAIKSVHLGNPKKLYSFYKKEKWHALGMMGTFKISCLDKPVIMTVLFLVLNALAIILFFVYVFRGSMSVAMMVLVASSLLVPIVTAIYRITVFKNKYYFVQLVALYWVYYLARTQVLISVVFNHVFERE